MVDPESTGRRLLSLNEALQQRNILVHEYAEVDLEVVASVLQGGLDDLRQFAAKVGELLGAAGY